MKWWCVAATLVIIGGCASGDAGPTTMTVLTDPVAAIAAPTAAQPEASSATPPATTAPSLTSTTTVGPTTSAATTAAPSTAIPPDPVEAAKRDVADRYEAFSVAANECVAEPSGCDLPSVLGEFATPEADLYQLYENRWTEFGQNNQRVEQLDKVERRIASLEVEQQFIFLTACVVDGAVLVDEDGAVVDDGIGYRREDTIWQQIDGSWRLVGGTNYRVEPTSEGPCEF